MIGVILAAGMAKRLRPLTDERPKCLLKVGQRTLLQRTVDAVINSGIDELVVVTGYKNNMIVDFLKTNYPSLTIHFIDNPDYAHNNNIFSLWLTRPYTEGKDFLLLDSDILLIQKEKIFFCLTAIFCLTLLLFLPLSERKELCWH